VEEKGKNEKEFQRNRQTDLYDEHRNYNISLCSPLQVSVSIKNLNKGLCVGIKILEERQKHC